MRTFFFTFLLALTFVALPVFAADNFVPLAPIPNLDTGSGATLGSYINSVFLLVISVAAMLAVLRIVLGGFQYMTQEAVDDKQTARNTIQNAVIGLLLLLGMYLILNVINPQILSLDSLQFNDLRPSAAVQKQINQDQDAMQTFLGTLLGKANTDTQVFKHGTTANRSADKCEADGGTVQKSGRLCKSTPNPFASTYTKSPLPLNKFDCFHSRYVVSCQK